MADRPNTNYSAPILSVDLTPWEQDGTPIEVWPCNDCLPWHIEVVTDEDDEVWVREWHAAECPTFKELLGEGDS